MSDFKVASRYAKSLIDLALEKNKVEELYQDMVLISNSCKNSMELRLMLASPIVSHDKKLACINALFSSKVNSISQSFFHLLVNKRRESVLLPIADEYIVEYKKLKNIVSISLTTATAISEEEKKSIISSFDSNISTNFSLVHTIDPAIIGGYIIKSGDNQLDNSVKSKLSKFKNSFSNNA